MARWAGPWPTSPCSSRRSPGPIRAALFPCPSRARSSPCRSNATSPASGLPGAPTQAASRSIPPFRARSGRPGGVREPRVRGRRRLPRPVRRRGDLPDSPRRRVCPGTSRGVRHRARPAQGDDPLERRAGPCSHAGGSAGRRPASRRPSGQGAGVHGRGRRPRPADGPGAAVPPRDRVGNGDRRPADVDVRRLDAKLLRHHPHGLPGDLRACRVHRRRAAGRAPARGASRTTTSACCASRTGSSRRPGRASGAPASRAGQVPPLPLSRCRGRTRPAPRAGGPSPTRCRGRTCPALRVSPGERARAARAARGRASRRARAASRAGGRT